MVQEGVVAESVLDNERRVRNRLGALGVALVRVRVHGRVADDARDIDPGAADGGDEIAVEVLPGDGDDPPVVRGRGGAAARCAEQEHRASR